MDPALYDFSLLGVLHFSAAFPMVIAAVWVFTRNPGALTNQAFSFAEAIPGLIWLWSFGFMYSCLDPDIASLWGRIGYAALTMVLAGVFLSAAAFTSRLKDNKRRVQALYIVAILLALEFIFGDFAIKGIRQFEWGIYPDYGPGMILFFGYVAYLMIHSFIILYQALVAANSNVQKMQIKIFIFAYILGTGWLVELLPVLFGFNMYPLGFVSITILIFVLGWNLHEYRFLDPTPEHVASKLVATSREAFVTMDADGIIRMTNAKMEQLLRYKKSEIVNKYFSDFVKLNEDASSRRFIKTFKEYTEHPDSRFLLLKDSRGKVVPVSINMAEIKGLAGNVLGAVLSCQDLRETLGMREALKEKEEKLEAVLDNMPEGVAIRSANGRIEYISQAMTEMFGDQKNRRCYELFKGKKTMCADCPVETLFAQNSLRTIYSYSSSDSRRTFEVVAVPLHYSNTQKETKSALMIIRNITERKQREEMLKKANEELKTIDKMKDDFLSSVSHELRTPLTSIRSFSEILLTYQNEDPKTRLEFLEIINKESERLTRLIDNVLDLSRIKEGKMTWHDQKVSINESIQEVVSIHRHLLHAKAIRPLVNSEACLPEITIDPDRLKQILTNLVSNAVKFSYHGEDILIQASRAESNNGNKTVEWVKVSITDHGVGLDAKDLEYVFERFHQIEDAGKVWDHPKGSGVGLYICQEIISHYQGSIWVESKKGEGSTFHFMLPVHS